jgi:hypothetical protein
MSTALLILVVLLCVYVLLLIIGALPWPGAKGPQAIAAVVVLLLIILLVFALTGHFRIG